MSTEEEIGVQRNVHIPHSLDKCLPSAVHVLGAGERAGEEPVPNPCSHGAYNPVGGGFRWTGDKSAAPATWGRDGERGGDP